MTHIHWLPQPDFLKLAAKITLPRLGAPAVTLDHFKTIGEYLAEGSPANPLEEQTVMDFRTLNQPHDLRSQLGLAMSPDPVEPPDLLKGSTSITADEPSCLGDQMIAERATSQASVLRAQLMPENEVFMLGAQIAAGGARMIHEAHSGCTSRQQAERIGAIKTQPGKSNLMYHLHAISGKDVRIDGMPLEDFIESVGPEVTAVEASRVTAKSLRIGGLAVGGSLELCAQPSMKERLDDLDEQTLSLLIEVGNRPGHDRRRVDAARTQFELAFMMLKRAIEEG